jgi:hypothetical protein
MAELRTWFRRVEDLPTPDLWSEIQGRVGDSSRDLLTVAPVRPLRSGAQARRIAAAVIALALFAGTSVLAWQALGPLARGAGDRETFGAGPWAGLAPGWTRLPPPPFPRAEATEVWTDGSLIYWGGSTDFDATQHGDGAAFDPIRKAWRKLPPAPLSPRTRARGVWTGSEMIVWGGWSGETIELHNDGAAYNPRTSSWRKLPLPPIELGLPAAAVWTGRELILWGSGRTAGETRGAAYDPEADSWRMIPPAPMALNSVSDLWTGDEMIVYGSRLEGGVSVTLWARGMAYDPTKDMWRILPERHLSPYASSAVWTGEEMVAWDYEGTSAAYDPATDTWRDLPPMPMEGRECYPDSALADGVVFAWYCGQAAALDTRTQTWSPVDVGPIDPEQPDAMGDVVSADRAAVLFYAPPQGNVHTGEMREMWAYSPEPEARAN